MGWCLCGAKPTMKTASLYLVSATTCKTKKLTGSCGNNIACPRNDGSCGINVYGHIASNRGMTCDKACAKVGLACSQAVEGTNNCACSHLNAFYQTFDCGRDLSRQPHRRSKAHFWCMCGSKPPSMILPVSRAQCSSVKYTGSCGNNPSCPRSDGTCGINVYGHRGSDNGNTCTRACAKVGLACTQAVEGTNNCNCGHLNSFYQTFSCDQNLHRQPHKRSKAHFWCLCAQAPPKLTAVPASECRAASARNIGSCSNKVTCPRTDGSCGINVYGHRSSDRGMTC